MILQKFKQEWTMNSNNIIVQEYLSSLKEDKELDSLFPILLNAMGFRIVQTAKESKGQSQYGKDIIAIGNDDKGAKYRWYFELKGYENRDITDKNYSIPDGIRESIIEAKDTAFNDSSIPQFNTLPIKIILVHNGVLKTNIRPTFEGFISKEFKEGEFERWDIYHLTDLFSEFLFNTYLLPDEESNRLFKKTLAFLDTPDYDYRDFKMLVELQFEKADSAAKGRIFTKLFSTLNLLERIIFHYSKLNNNLIAAKECSKFLIIRTWSWILKNGLETKRAVLNEYRKLLRSHYDIFNTYFKKTFPIARIDNGLYAENGAFFEAIGYPLRCFDYLEDLLHYCRLRLYFPNFDKESANMQAIRNKQKDLLIELITNNSGFFRPILDNHSIAITQLFIFFAQQPGRRQKDIDFIASYIFNTVHNIIINKLKHDRLPELYNRVDVLAESIAKNEKSEEYNDTSSILIGSLLELIVIIESEETYSEILKHLSKDLSIQIPHPNFKEYNVEQLLFEKNMHDEYYVECLEPLPEKFEDFIKLVKDIKIDSLEYRTDKVGFSYLRYLAHSYFKNELVPEEWMRFSE